MRRIKSFIAISLSIILVLSLFATIFPDQKVLAQSSTSTNNNKGNSPFLKFINATSGVNISYPTYWKKTEGKNIVSFVSPLKTVGVTFVTIPFINMSLDEFTAKRILALRDNLINFNINRSRNEVFLYSPAQMLMFTYGQPSNESKILQAWTIKYNKAYIVTYFADAVLFDTFLSTALKVINSFQINSQNIPTAISGSTSNMQSNVIINNKSYPIIFSITGVGNKLSNITADINRAMIQVKINSNSNGTLTIYLPRKVIDSKLRNNTDDNYVVFVDGNDDTHFSEKRSTEFRTLMINFDKGAQQIDITGTQMVPEFGSIAFTLFALAIFGIIIFNPEYRKRYVK